MKILKTASGSKIKLSKKEWESIGKKAGWFGNTESMSGDEYRIKVREIVEIYLDKFQEEVSAEIPDTTGTVMPINDGEGDGFTVDLSALTQDPGGARYINAIFERIGELPNLSGKRLSDGVLEWRVMQADMNSEPHMTEEDFDLIKEITMR